MSIRREEYGLHATIQTTSGIQIDILPGDELSYCCRSGPLVSLHRHNVCAHVSTFMHMYDL